MKKKRNLWWKRKNKMPFRIGRLKRRTFSVLRTQPSGRERNCGHFDLLPPEILYEIFNHLTLAEIGQLSLASESFRAKIIKWVWTAQCQNRALSNFRQLFSSDFEIPGQITSKNAVIQKYLAMTPNLDDFGLMCKRLTCLSHTCDRINFAFTAFDFCLRRHCDELEAEVKKGKAIAKSTDWVKAIHLFQFMKMMHTFTKGWESVEFSGILQQIETSFKISQDLSQVINSPNVFQVSLEIELKLRLVLRTLMWDVTGDDYSERAGWIMATLKYFIGTHCQPRAQAIFFLVTFGYACDDGNDHYDDSASLSFYQRAILEDIHNHTDWDCFGEYVPEDFHDGKKMFLTIAQAICSCMLHDPSWKNEMLSPVLNEIFKIPSPWRHENIASFLLFCSESLINHYIGDMILDGEDAELSRAAKLIVDMIIMSHRFDNDLSSDKGVGRVFDKLCSKGPAQTRRRFHEKIWQVITANMQENMVAMLNDNAEFDILRNFGVHLMKKAYATTPVKLDEMEIEE